MGSTYIRVITPSTSSTRGTNTRDTSSTQEYPEYSARKYYGYEYTTVNVVKLRVRVIGTQSLTRESDSF